MAELARIRTDVVGSLLRPDYVKEAYRRYGRGELDADGLRAIQDRAVREAVALQEAAGVEVLTDGELRRLNFQDSFADSVAGFQAGRQTIAWHESRPDGQPLTRFDHRPTEPQGPAVSQRRPVQERLRQVRNLPLEEYRFVSQVARLPAKVTLIGPDRITQRWDRERSAPVYPD